MSNIPATRFRCSLFSAEGFAPLMGRPQAGQLAAAVLTFPPQSGHRVRGIASTLKLCGSRGN